MSDFDDDSMSRHFAGRVRYRRDFVLPGLGQSPLSPRQYRHPRRPYPNALPTAGQNEPNLPLVVTAHGKREVAVAGHRFDYGLLPTPYAGKAASGAIAVDSAAELPSKSFAPGEVATFKSGDTSRLVLHNKAGVVRVTQVGGVGGGVDTLLNVGDSVDLDPDTTVQVKDMDGSAHTLAAFEYH